MSKPTPWLFGYTVVLAGLTALFTDVRNGPHCYDPFPYYNKVAVPEHNNAFPV